MFACEVDDWPRSSWCRGVGDARALLTRGPHDGWPDAGYRLTVFSTWEGQQLEGPSGFGGNVQFYPVNALAEAGAHADMVANWHSNVVVDRELITGQQPMSAPEFEDVLVAKVNARAH